MTETNEMQEMRLELQSLKDELKEVKEELKKVKNHTHFSNSIIGRETYATR